MFAGKVDHAARRRDIVMRAMKLFSQFGYDNVTFLMIAETCGLSRTVIYRDFRSKREILDAAIRANADTIMEGCAAVAASGLDAVEKLKRVGEHVTDCLFGTREFLTVIYDFVLAMNRVGEDMGQRVFSFTQTIRSTMCALIDAGRKDGMFSRETNSRLLTEILVAEMESTTLRIVLGMERDAREASRRFSVLVDAFVLLRKNA